MRGWRAIAVLSVGSLDLAFEQTIVAPVLPAIERQFHSSPTATAWLLTGFLIASALATALAGRLGDQFGRRRVLLGSLAIFALGALICAVGGSIASLIAGRIIQGFGAGIGPLALALACEGVERRRVPLTVAIFVGIGGLGAVIALLVVGPLADHISVRAVFWLLLALAALLAIAIAALVEESVERLGRRLDLTGAALLTGTVGAAMYAISEGNDWGWGSPRVLILIACAVLALIGFVLRELRAAEPLINPRVLARRAVWSANVVIVGLGFAEYVAFTLVSYIAGYPKLTGYGLGDSTATIGLILVPVSLATIVSALAGARLLDRVGPRLLVLAAALGATVSYVLLVLLPRDTAVLALVPIPLGLGTGLVLSVARDLIVLASDSEELAGALGLTSVLAAIASGLGSQVAVALLTASGADALGLPLRAGFTHAFVMAAIASAVAALMVFAIPVGQAVPVAAEVPG